MSQASQVIIVRKDITMSPVVFGNQVAHASHVCAVKCISACVSGIGQYSSRCAWYKKWIRNDKYERIFLGVDNEDQLWNAHNKILKISQDIPLYISKIKGYSSDNPEMVSCLCIGPVYLDLIRPVIMHFQII